MVQLSAYEIKRIRIDMGLTQEELAQEMGVAVSTVNRWENGRSKPGKMACKILLTMKGQYHNNHS